MGMIINGLWSDIDQVISNGSFLRPPTHFRSRDILTDIDGNLAPQRYILFISLSCPWCHRVTITHQLKDLDKTLKIHIVGEPRDQGYALAGGEDCFIAGLSHPVRYLHELYSASAKAFTGRSTIPVLWDIQAGKIINNESSDIVHILNGLTQKSRARKIDLRPNSSMSEIKRWNDILYHGLNNAVYEAGFAKTQEIYETAVEKVFTTLDQLEDHLEHRAYMVGHTITETDCRLYPTLVRFDPVYHSHFKCSLRRVADYPNLSRYVSTLERRHDLANTVDMNAIRFAYFYNDRSINPHGIIPLAAGLQRSNN